MKRIYIAGPLGPRQVGVGAGTLAIEYLMNVRTMIQAAVECIDRGWSPFCPGLDFTYFISLPDGKVISEDKIKGVSMAWVEVCDALLLVGDWTKSRGALAERDRAIEFGLTIYGSLDDVPMSAESDLSAPLKVEPIRDIDEAELLTDLLGKEKL